MRKEKFINFYHKHGLLFFTDTIKIWKFHDSVRMDYQLVGIKNLKAKKRDISILFNPLDDVSKRKDVKEFDSGKSIDLIWLINRTKGFFTNPLVVLNIFIKEKHN